MLKKIEDILIRQTPDWVLVYGDTNSTLAGALAASKLLIPVIHVEAGLRSYNMAMPEEQNRILTDHLASVLFCPTETAVCNLAEEGIGDQKRNKRVYNSGDVMYDAVLYNLNLARNQSARVRASVLEPLGCKGKDYVLTTVHRAENTDDVEKLTSILNAFEVIGAKIIFPLHPRTRKYLEQYRIKVPKNVTIIDPVGYLEMLFLESNAKVIATDSGGIQKEAFFLNVPCITLRNETEWVETVACGWNQLVGTDPEKIINCLAEIENRNWQKPAQDFFGNGKAGEIIVDQLTRY
jgi:UDP-GlcNAc3NAcA epimerase